MANVHGKVHVRKHTSNMLLLRLSLLARGSRMLTTAFTNRTAKVNVLLINIIRIATLVIKANTALDAVVEEAGGGVARAGEV